MEEMSDQAKDDSWCTMRPVVLPEQEEEEDDDDDEDDKQCAYPIKLKSSVRFLLQLLPLLEVSCRAMAAINGLAAIPHAFGYSVPQLSKEVTTQAKNVIQCLKVESSVKRYNILDTLVTSIILSAADVGKERESDDNKANANEEEDQPKPQQMQGKQKVRGGALRELQQFYEVRKLKDFAGLVRVGLSNGEAYWTTEAGKAILLDEEHRRGVLQEEAADEEDGKAIGEEAFVAGRKRKRRFNEKEEEEEEEYEVAGGCQHEW